MSALAMPQLPSPRGPISDAVVGFLDGSNPDLVDLLELDCAEPIGDDDLQLALYMLYELHYLSFEGVDDQLQWDPELIALRIRLERAFLAAVALKLGPDPDPCRPGEIGQRLFELADADEGPSLSRFLEAKGNADHFKEFAIHRSAYQLKEADPHTWAIPRTQGPPKAALVEIQADEYGGGNHRRMHSRLFADAMEALGLDSAYGAYLDRIPGISLAGVNLISAFGLNRRWRGAIVGHLATFEITSPGPNRRYASGLRRLGLDAATPFYDEHVEADSVHENIAAYDLAQGLATQEPELTGDIIFGARALHELDRRFADYLLDAWNRGESSLLRAAIALPA
jgi:hypothetical protein